MFKQAFKNIDDILWKEAGCTTELDYTSHDYLFATIKQQRFMVICKNNRLTPSPTFAIRPRKQIFSGMKKVYCPVYWGKIL